MTRPHILVLGCASRTAHGRDQMRRLSVQARRRGARLIGADTAGNLRHAIGELVDELVELQVHDIDACRAWVAADRPRIDAVLTFREMCVEPVAAVASELGIAGNDPAAVRTIRHKDLARERLRAAGFAQPRTLLAAGEPEAADFMAATAPGPWVVKPRSGMGSEGVALVCSRTDLPVALTRLDGTAPFLVETFVTGPEYSAEGVFVGGQPHVLALTEKSVTDGFIETGHRTPADLPGELAEQARLHVVGALTAIGLTRGVFHVEFWLSSSGIVLGELHARPGGDFIHALVEHTRPGLELYGTVIDDLLNSVPDLPPGPTGAAGTEYVIAPPGRVRTIEGWSTITNNPLILAADLAIRVGEEIAPVRSSADRHAAVVVGASSRTEVDAQLRDLVGSLQITVD